MAWETRRRGGTYYTRTVRVGEGRQREYVGAGLLGELAELEDEQAREERQASRDALAAEQARWAELEAPLERLDAAAATLTTAALLAAGYHRHHGQWRKRHGQ